MQHLALHQDGAVLRRVLETVGDEVLQHLAELQLVAHHRETLRGVRLEGDAALGGEDLQLERAVPAHAAHVEQLDVEGHPGLLALAALEERLDHLQDLPRLADDGLGRGAEVAREVRVLEHPPVPERDLQGRAEVVADDGDQLVLEPGQLAEPAVGLGQLAVALDVGQLEVVPLLLHRGVELGVADRVGEGGRHGLGELLLLRPERPSPLGQPEEQRADEVVLADERLDQDALHHQGSDGRHHVRHQRILERVLDVGGLARLQRAPQLGVLRQVDGDGAVVVPLPRGHHHGLGGAGRVHQDDRAAVGRQHLAHLLDGDLEDLLELERGGGGLGDVQEHRHPLGDASLAVTRRLRRPRHRRRGALPVHLRSNFPRFSRH